MDVWQIAFLVLLALGTAFAIAATVLEVRVLKLRRDALQRENEEALRLLVCVISELEGGGSREAERGVVDDE